MRSCLAVCAASMGLALGCGPRLLPAGYAGPSVTAFVSENHGALAADIDRGSGEAIYDLAKVAGCQDIAALGRTLHRKRERIYAPASELEAGAPERILDIMKDTSELRCTDLDLSPQRKFAAGRRRILGGRPRTQASDRYSEPMSSSMPMGTYSQPSVP